MQPPTPGHIGLWALIPPVIQTPEDGASRYPYIPALGNVDVNTSEQDGQIESMLALG